MDDDKLIMYTFANMTTLEQHTVLDLCMRQSDIQWTKLFAKFFVEFKNKDYLLFMVQEYKDLLNEQSTISTYSM